MPSSTEHAGSRASRVVTGMLLLAACSAAGGPAGADEVPALRQGLWKFHRVVAGKPMDVTRCADPREDMKRQNAMLTKFGCRFTPLKRIGNTYTFIADCTIKNSAGGTVTSHSKSVITVESENAYKVEVETSANGQTQKELLLARRTGDCRGKE
jgi:hypothetical protein